MHGFLPFGPGIPAHAPRMPVYPSMDPSWSNPAPPPSSLPRPYSLAEASQHLGEVQGPKLPLVRYSDRLNRPPPASHVVEPTTEAQVTLCVVYNSDVLEIKFTQAQVTLCVLCNDVLEIGTGGLLLPDMLLIPAHRCVFH